MRILFFSRDYTTHDHRFLSKLSTSSHEIFFLRLEDDGIKYDNRPLPEGVHSVEWPQPFASGLHPVDYVRHVPTFERLLVEISPDVVHAGPVQTCGFITALSRFHPFIVMSWGADILLDAHKNTLWNWITRYTLSQSDWLVCDSDAVRASAQRLVPYENGRIVQFPWGVELQKYTPGDDETGLRKRLGWEQAYVIISTRSWENVYGIDVLLAAFTQAQKKRRNLRLLLIGDGSLANDVDEYISEYNLERVVHCTGRISQEHLINYFRAANVYVSCSYSDGSSISLLEAMAAGLAVVVSDISGNREWVQPGVNGWLESTDDAAGFAEAILCSAALEAHELHEIGRTNRNLVENHADWSTNSDQLLMLYEYIEVIGKSL